MNSIENRGSQKRSGAYAGQRFPHRDTWKLYFSSRHHCAFQNGTSEKTTAQEFPREPYNYYIHRRNSL